jgi:GntR family transcriptional regulator, transcriptional repressor for pyruvate dehydrogenase complex
VTAASGRRTEKASERLALEIVQTIYETKMQPGDHYLSEAEALRTHGVARSTYREALRFLEIQGVVRVRNGPGGGPVISQPGWPHLASSVALLLQFANAPMQAVMEARNAIEPGMAEMAAANADDNDILAMDRDLAEIEETVGNYKRYVVAYMRFWNHLAQSTHNELLAFLCPALRSIVDSAGFVPNELYRLETLKRLRVIHAAIAEHDATGARDAMRNLELEFLNRLTEGYPQQMKRVVAWSDLEVSLRSP